MQRTIELVDVPKKYIGRRVYVVITKDVDGME